MKLYELNYLILPDLKEEELKLLQEKIVSLIQEKGGVLVSNTTAVKKLLFYPIKKRTEAFLATLSFQLNPEKLADLEKKLKEEKNILRYLIVSKRVYKKTLPPERPKRTIKREKVELKDIDKKLKEILGEL